MKKSHNSMGMGKTNDKEKIATALTITIFEKTSTSHRVGLPRTCKRRSTTTKPRLVYTKRDVLSGANINNFADKTKLFELINNFNIDDAEAFIKAIGKCFPQQEEKEHRLKASFDSKYQILDFSEFGVKVLLRVSDHNINAFNIQDDIDEAYSLVVKDRKSKNTFVNRDDITIREYVYWEENCNRDRYLKIAQNIYKFLETSEWDEDYVKADATNPPATEGLGDYPITHDVGDIVAAPEYNKIFLVVEVDSRNDRPTFFRAMNTDRRDRETIYKFTFNDDRIERCYAYSVNKPKFKIGAITNAGQIVDLKILPDFKKDNREIKAYYSYKILKDGGKYSYYDEDVLREIAPNIAPQTEESKYKVGDRVRFYYVADEYEGIIVRKEGEIFIVKVPYGDGYRLRSASYKDIISISTDSKSLFQFAQHLSSRFDDGESYDWAKVQKMAKELGVKSTQQELMQACELAVVLSARRIAQNSEWSEGQCFEQMKRLYQLQPIISTNSSESLRLQQYSTPCPISYLAGLYVSRGNGQLYYEPTAGNGMLTVALPPDRTIVNELDPVRVANLKMNGFADVLNDDAVRLADSPLAQRKYNVIMNPPFGSLKPSEYLYRDGKVADNEATYTFKRLDHKIAVLTLEKFLADDNARAAIIVGGKLAAKYNKADDEAYWNKQGRLQGAFGDFISYLNRAYLIDDIFYLDGKLYGKQGTQFPIVMILVRGRRKQWDGDPLCKWRTYDSIRDKQVQSFDELLIRMRPYLAHTDHEALVQRLNAKLVRLERMKIETGTETPKFKYEIGDKFRNEKDGNICTIVDRFVSDGKIGYYLIFPNKVQEQHPVITEENWLDSLVKLPLPKYKVGQMVKWHLVNWTNGYVKDVNWDNLFNTYKYEIIDFSGGMAYEVKEYSMSKISLGYSEEKSYSISQPVCKEGDLIRDKKTKKTYTVRNVLLFNVYHKYKNQRLGVGGTVVKSSASYLYYVCEHRSPYIEKGFAVVEKSLGDANSFEKYQDFIQNALHSNSHGKIECTDLISEHSRQVVNRLLKKNIKGYYIKADDIRHTRNEHGKQSEYLRNQIPITDEDLAKIPEILSVPTSIDLPPYNMRNGQGVRFVKQFADGKIFCVMVDLYESEELSIKTGYKKGIEGFETLMPSPLQGIDELQQAVPKHNVRNARALPMLVANVTNFFRIK